MPLPLTGQRSDMPQPDFRDSLQIPENILDISLKHNVPRARCGCDIDYFMQWPVVIIDLKCSG